MQKEDNYLTLSFGWQPASLTAKQVAFGWQVDKVTMSCPLPVKQGATLSINTSAQPTLLIRTFYFVISLEVPVRSHHVRLSEFICTLRFLLSVL